MRRGGARVFVARGFLRIEAELARCGGALAVELVLAVLPRGVGALVALVLFVVVVGLRLEWMLCMGP